MINGFSIIIWCLKIYLNIYFFFRKYSGVYGKFLKNIKFKYFKYFWKNNFYLINLFITFILNNLKVWNNQFVELIYENLNKVFT